MTDTWIVLVEDRHSDVDALPFSTEEAAVAKARSWVPPEYAEAAALTPRMREDGWVLCLRYGTEGDRVRVVKRAMDDAGRLR
jgi:hypothetical protein